MTMAVLLLPWFVVARPRRCRPSHALIAAVAGRNRRGAADPDCDQGLWRGPAAAGHLRDSGGAGALSLRRGAVLRHSRSRCHQARHSSARPHLLRAAAGRAAGRAWCPRTRPSRSFACAATSSIGLSFYRNREVVNYEEERRARRAAFAGGARVRAAMAPICIPRPRSRSILKAGIIEQLFSWPEQGLEVYLVGSAIGCSFNLRLSANSWQSAGRHFAVSRTCAFCAQRLSESSDRSRRALRAIRQANAGPRACCGHSAAEPRTSEGNAGIGASIEILDLRHFAAPVLRPVLEAEGELWEQRLHWDYRASARLLMQYLDNHMLPGYAALEAGR